MRTMPAFMQTFTALTAACSFNRQMENSGVVHMLQNNKKEGELQT